MNYFDTDSIKCISNPDQPNSSAGKIICEITAELKGYGVGSQIMECVSGGPKIYANMIWSTKDEI